MSHRLLLTKPKSNFQFCNWSIYRSVSEWLRKRESSKKRIEVKTISGWHNFNVDNSRNCIQCDKSVTQCHQKVSPFFFISKTTRLLSDNWIDCHTITFYWKCLSSGVARESKAIIINRVNSVDMAKYWLESRQCPNGGPIRTDQSETHIVEFTLNT